MKDELKEKLAHMIGYEDWGDKSAEDVVEDIFSLIDGERCVWTADKYYFTASCNRMTYEKRFWMVQGRFYCPCCGKRIEVKEVKDGQ